MSTKTQSLIPTVKFSEMKAIIASHIGARDFKTVHIVQGSPGCGKTALGYELYKESSGFFKNFFDINPSLMDAPDIGLAYPNKETGVLDWYVSNWVKALETGPSLVLIDELGDANMMMQNYMRRLFWAREVYGVKVHPETLFLCFTNRSIDKSGAGTLSGKVKNATSQYTMESNLNDWVEWANRSDINPMVVSYLRWSHHDGGSSLDRYDPLADASPTPRQWELVNYVPLTLSNDLYQKAVASKVGMDEAIKFTTFRKIHDSLVGIDEILAAPSKVPMPEQLDVRYAMLGHITHHAKAENIERLSIFVERMQKDFQLKFWQDSIKRNPKMKGTKEFIKWMSSSNNVITSGV